MGNLNNVPFEIVNGTPAELELCQVLRELHFRLSIGLIFERSRAAVVELIIIRGDLIRS